MTDKVTAEETIITPGTSSALPEGFHSLPKRQIVFTMVGVMLATLLSALDQTIVGTAMPRIIADLNGFEHYAWVVTAYMVTSTTTVPIMGKLTDLYSRKWLFFSGIVFFLFTSALCGLSQSMTQLIIFRGLQGIGAGTMMANSFTVIGDLFPPVERGKYQGFVGAMFGLASVVGPTTGGYITDNLSWHWVFFVNLPLGLVVVAVFLLFFPHVSPVGNRQQIDFAGAGTLILCVVPLLLALSWAGTRYEWGSPEVVALLGFAVLMAIVFVLIEGRASEPTMPLELFANPIFRVSVVLTFLTGVGMFGMIIFIPLFVQGALGNSATVSGNVLTPMTLAMVIGNVSSGQVLARAGGRYRIQALLGLGIMTFGTFLLVGMGLDTSNLVVSRNIAIAGFGLGITMPLFIIAVQNSVPYRLLGVSTASTQFFRSIGGTVGVSLLGTVMTNRFTTEFRGLIPQAAGNALTPDTISQMLSNPEALVSPEARDQLMNSLPSLGAAGQVQAEQFLSTMREALALSLHDVFLAGALLCACAFVIALFLKEIPLRKKHTMDSPAR